jgi:hypothetical protein
MMAPATFYAYTLAVLYMGQVRNCGLRFEILRKMLKSFVDLIPLCLRINQNITTSSAKHNFMFSENSKSCRLNIPSSGFMTDSLIRNVYRFQRYEVILD